MNEVLAVVRFVRDLVQADELLSQGLPGGVGVQGDPAPSGCDAAQGLPRAVTVGLLSASDTNSLGLDRITSDVRMTVRVYGRAGDRYADIKQLANQLDLLLQGARHTDSDPRFIVERQQPLMGRETDGSSSYPFLGGIYRFLITPESPDGV